MNLPNPNNENYYDTLISQIKNLDVDTIDDAEITKDEELVKEKWDKFSKEHKVSVGNLVDREVRKTEAKVTDPQKVYFWIRLFVEDEELDILPNDELLMKYKWAPDEELTVKFVCYGKKGLAHDHDSEIVNYNPEDDKKTLCLLVDSDVVNHSDNIPFLRKLFRSSFYFEEEIIKREDMTFTNQRTGLDVIYFDADF